MKSDMKSRLLENGQSAWALGLGGYNFSRRIAGKYGIFRKSGRLPSLIFLRLSGLEAKNKKSDPAHRISINNYLKFQFSFYFEFIRQLIKTPDNYHLQKLYNIINIKNGGYLLQSDKRSGAAAKTSEKAAIGIFSHKPFAPLFFGQRSVDFKANPVPRLNIGQSGNVVNDSQQNGLTFFNNSAVYQNERIFTYNQFSSSYPVHDDKKTIEPLPPGIKASHEEVFSARAMMNAKPPEGTNAFRNEFTVSNIDYETFPESGNAGRIFLPTRSYLTIRPVRMVTYSANVTVNNSQRLSYVWISGSRHYQIGYSPASGKQPEERHSSHAKMMNFHSAGKDEASAKPPYPQKGAEKGISYENNPQESETGENLLFNGSHLITRPVNMTLIDSNIHSNLADYSKRTTDIEAGSQSRIIQTPVSGLRNPIKDGEFLEPQPYRMDALSTAKKLFTNVSSRNKGSRENILNEKNQSLEPALSRTDGHPTIKNALNRGMTETGKSHKTLPGSRLITKPLKTVLNPSYNEDQFEESSRINADGADIRKMTEEGTEPGLQNRTLLNRHYENIIREYEKTGSKNTINTYHGGTILKPAEDQFSDFAFPRRGINLKYANDTPMKIPTGEHAYNSSQELIYKKPVVPETEIIPESREQAEKTATRNINDAFIRESFKEKPFHEISRIADTVYKMIEKRISIEKDRRGLS